MSIATPPPAPASGGTAKKAGLGCCGCGCIFLVVVALLLGGLVAGLGYMAYDEGMKLTTTTPADVETLDGGPDVFQSTQRKMADFDHDVKNHQAATITLTAAEINTLIAENPDIRAKNIRANVTFSGKEARLQCCVPTDAITALRGGLSGRYANFDTTFEVFFDPDTKSIIFDFSKLAIGPMVLIGPGAEESGASAGFVRGFSKSFGPTFSAKINEQIRAQPDGAALLDQAKSVEIQNGQLVIQTQ